MNTTIYRDSRPGQGVMLLMGNDSQVNMKKFMVQGVRHMQKRYYWRDLEPTKDTYSFTELASDIAFCAANGCMLTAMIQDKTFNSTAHPLPKGMEQYELENRVVVGGGAGTGLTSKRWDPVVVAQFNKLTAKLTQFDGQPGFNGIATCETSLSVDLPILTQHGYTPEAYRDSYIATLIKAATNLPHSNVYWTMNFLVKNQSYIGEVADAVRAYGVQMGGPDCLPNSASLLTAAYPFYATFKGRIRMFIQVSPPGYSVPDADGPGKFLTMTDILNFAKDTLFVNTMFWYPVGQPSDPSKGYGWNDAAAVIAANPIINP